MPDFPNARCIGLTDLFYPDQGDNLTAAKSICLGCEHKQACLRHALDHPEEHGVWGGTSPRERRKIRRREQKARHG